MAEAATLAEDLAKTATRDFVSDTGKFIGGDESAGQWLSKSPPAKITKWTADTVNNALVKVVKSTPLLGDAVKMAEESMGDIRNFAAKALGEQGTLKPVVNLHPEDVIIPDGRGGTMTVKATPDNMYRNDVVKAIVEHPDTHPAIKAEGAKFIANAAELDPEALHKALNSYLQVPIEGNKLYQQEVRALMKHYRNSIPLDSDGSIMSLDTSYASGELPETLSARKLNGDFSIRKGKRIPDQDLIAAELPNGIRQFQQRVNSSLVNHILDAPETELTKAQKARLLRPYFTGKKPLDKKLFTSVRERVAKMKLFDAPAEDIGDIVPPPEEELIKLSQEAEEDAIRETKEESQPQPQPESQPQPQPESQPQPQPEPQSNILPKRILEKEPLIKTDLEKSVEAQINTSEGLAEIEQPDEIKQLLSPAEPKPAFKQITALTREEEELIREAVDKKLPNATQAEKDTVIRKIEQEEIEARRKAAPPKVEPVGDPGDIGGVKRLLAGTEKAEAKIARDAELEQTRLKAVDAESRAFLKPADINTGAVEESIITPPKGFEDETSITTPTEGRLLSDLTEEEKLGAQFRDFTDEELGALPTGEPLGPTRIQQIKDFFNSDEFKIAMTGSVVGGTLAAGITAALSRIKAHVDKLDAPTLKQIKELATTVATVDRTIQQLKKNYGDLLKQYNKPSNSKVDNRTTKNQLNRMKAEIAKQSQLVNKERSMLTKEIITAAKDVQQQVMDDRKAAVKGTLSDRSQKGLDDGVLKIAPDKQERYSVPIKLYINNNNQSPESNFQNKNAK